MSAHTTGTESELFENCEERQSQPGIDLCRACLLMGDA